MKDDDVAKAIEDSEKAIKGAEAYFEEEYDLQQEVTQSLGRLVKDKPFLMIVKVLLHVAAYFFVLLKPGALKWFTMVKLVIGEFEKAIRGEVAAAIHNNNEAPDDYIEEIEGGVPMSIKNDYA